MLSFKIIIKLKIKRYSGRIKKKKNLFPLVLIKKVSMLVGAPRF